MSILSMSDARLAVQTCIAKVHDEAEQALQWESIKLREDLNAPYGRFEDAYTTLHDNMMRNDDVANAEAYQRMADEGVAFQAYIVQQHEAFQGLSNNLSAAYFNLLNALAALYDRMMDDACAHTEDCNRRAEERCAQERALRQSGSEVADSDSEVADSDPEVAESGSEMASSSSHSSQNTMHHTRPSEFNRSHAANMKPNAMAPDYDHKSHQEFNVQQQPSGLNLPRKTEPTNQMDLMDHRVMKKGPNDNFTKDTKQNVHNTQLTPFTRIFSYTSDHPTHTNQPHPALRNPEIVNMADFGGMVRTTIIIQVQNMAFERNPSFESDLADVLEALFSLPATDSYTGESTGAPAIIQVMRVSLPEEDKSLMDMLAGKWSVEVLSQEQDFVRVSVRPPLGLGRRAKAFFTSGCGIHNESSATAPLIMMDRHQFYIPFNTRLNHEAVRHYCEEIRKAAQASRHLYTDRLPSRPLKIKFEACKEGMDFLQEFPQR